MGLLRYQLFLTYAVAFFSLWYMALKKKDEFDLSPAGVLLIDLAPLWAIVAVGIYLLSVLIIGVLGFRDCPEAAVELEKEIQEAKQDARKRGLA